MSDKEAIETACASLRSYQPLAGDGDVAQAEAAGNWYLKAKAIFIWKNGRPVGIDAQQLDIWAERARKGDEDAKAVVLGAGAYRIRHFGRGDAAAVLEAEAIAKSIPVDPKRRRALKNADRNIAIAQAVLEVTALGYRPTRNVGSRDGGKHSACSIVVEALGRLHAAGADDWQVMSEDAVEKIWKDSGLKGF